MPCALPCALPCAAKPALNQPMHESRDWRRACSMDDCGKAAKIARCLRRRSDARGQEESGAHGQQGIA